VSFVLTVFWILVCSFLSYLLEGAQLRAARSCAVNFVVPVAFSRQHLLFSEARNWRI
jgi:hypothetical protein